MSEYFTNSVVDPLTSFADRMREEAGDRGRADKQLAATVGESIYQLIKTGQGSVDLSENLGHGAMGCEVGDSVIAIIPPMFAENDYEVRYSKKEGSPDRYIDVGTEDPGPPIPGKTLGVHAGQAPSGELGPLEKVPTYEGVRGGEPDDPQRNAEGESSRTVGFGEPKWTPLTGKLSVPFTNHEGRTVEVRVFNPPGEMRGMDYRIELGQPGSSEPGYVLTHDDLWDESHGDMPDSFKGKAIEMTHFNESKALEEAKSRALQLLHKQGHHKGAPYSFDASTGWNDMGGYTKLGGPREGASSHIIADSMHDAFDVAASKDRGNYFPISINNNITGEGWDYEHGGEGKHENLFGLEQEQKEHDIAGSMGLDKPFGFARKAPPDSILKMNDEQRELFREHLKSTIPKPEVPETPGGPQRNAFEDDPPEDDDPFNLGSFTPEGDPEDWKKDVDSEDIDPPGGPMSFGEEPDPDTAWESEHLSEDWQSDLELTPAEESPMFQPPDPMEPPEVGDISEKPERPEPPGPIGMPVEHTSYPSSDAYGSRFFSEKDNDVREAMEHDHNLHDIDAEGNELTEKDYWNLLRDPEVMGRVVPNNEGGTAAQALYRYPTNKSIQDIVSLSVDSDHPNALHNLFSALSGNRVLKLHVPAKKAENWLPHLASWRKSPGQNGTGWDWEQTGREGREGYRLTHNPRGGNQWGWKLDYAKWNMEGGQALDPHDPQHQATVYPPIDVGAPRVLSTELESGGKDLIAEGRFGDEDINEILQHLRKNVFANTADLRKQSEEVPSSAISSLKEFLESAEVKHGPQQNAKAGDRKLSKDGKGVLIKHTGGHWNRTRDARGKYFKYDDADTMIPPEKAGEGSLVTIDEVDEAGFWEDVLAGLAEMCGPQKNALMDSGEESQEEHHVGPPDRFAKELVEGLRKLCQAM